MNRTLGTILTAMITPFDSSGELDCEESRRIATWLVDRGNDGIVVAGSTGEGQTLDDRERSTLVKVVKDAVRNRAHVIANAGSNDTRDSIRSVCEAEAAGADGILAVVPYYNKPPQSGMIAHFTAVARATSLPVIIYNIPGRTGANMLPESVLEAASRAPNIKGIKESSGDLKQIGMLLRAKPKEFVVWSGDDHLFLPSLALGADGIVGVASHLCSLEYRRVLESFNAGDVAQAAAIHLSVLPLIDALFAHTSPIPIKWAMAQAGFGSGACRLPLDEMPEALAERLRPLLTPYVSAAVSR